MRFWGVSPNLVDDCTLHPLLCVRVSLVEGEAHSLVIATITMVKLVPVEVGM